MLNLSPALRRTLGSTRPAPQAAPSVPSVEAAGAAGIAAALLTPEEVGLRLGVTPQALERWRGNGAGPAVVRLSRKTIRYRAGDVYAFVTGRVVASTAA